MAEPEQSLPTPGLSHGTASASSPTPILSQAVGSLLPAAGLTPWAELNMSQAWPDNLEDPFADAMFDWFAWESLT